MALHTKWSSGDLIFYDGTQDIFTIKNSTGGLVVGESGDGVDFKFYSGTTGAYFHFDESADLVDFHNINVTNQDPQAQTSSTGENITLSSTSNRIQFLTSTAANFYVEVPEASGAGVAGIEFKILNSTGGTCTVYEGSTDGDLITTIPAGEGGIVISDNAEWRAIVAGT